MNKSDFHPTSDRDDRSALMRLAELFHQDFDLEFANVADGLRVYAEGINSQEKEQLARELEQLLLSTPTGGEIRRCLILAGAHNTVPNADLRSEFQKLIVLLRRGDSAPD